MLSTVLFLNLFSYLLCISDGDSHWQYFCYTTLQITFSEVYYCKLSSNLSYCTHLCVNFLFLLHTAVNDHKSNADVIRLRNIYVNLWTFELFLYLQAPHSFAYVSQESLSRAMLAAQQDIKQRKDDAIKHSDGIPVHELHRETKIVNSRGYVKRLNRRLQRKALVSYSLNFRGYLTIIKLQNYFFQYLLQ